MTIVLPDPRLEHPNLLVPGKKPNCPVVIDWTHPLAKGLEFFSIFNLGQPLDLVTNTRPSSVFGTPSIRRQRASFSADRYYFTRRRTPPDFGRTVICRCNPSQYGPDSFNYMINMHGANPYSALFAIYSTGYLQLTWNGDGLGYLRSNNGDVPTDTWGTYGATKGPGSTASDAALYKNGSSLSSASSADDSLAALNGGQIDVGGRSSGSRDFYGDMEFVAFWSIELTAREVKSFSDHPYQILIPA